MPIVANPSTHSYLDALEEVITDVIAPAASQIDRAAAFPRAGIDALGRAGLLGLVSALDVGGQGQAQRAAAMAVERLAKECGSTAMIVCMHYAGAAVIEAHGPRETREAIAAGRRRR